MKVLVAPFKGIKKRVELSKRLKYGKPNGLIATAWLCGNTLYVLSCTFKVHEFNIGDIEHLNRMPKNALAAMLVSVSGSRLHWDYGDIDLSLDSLLRLARRAKAARA